jgi:serine/threonine protein kinase
MGVVCYILLAGYAPFYDEDQKKLFEKIKKGKFHFHEDYWSRMSPDAIDLIKKMMTVDQKKRWTADQLLEHKWITASDSVLGSKDISSTIQELRKYNARRRLRAAMNAVIMANRIGNMIGMLSFILTLSLTSMLKPVLTFSPPPRENNVYIFCFVIASRRLMTLTYVVPPHQASNLLG